MRYPKAHELSVALVPDRTLADAIYAAYCRAAKMTTAGITQADLTIEQRRAPWRSFGRMAARRAIDTTHAHVAGEVPMIAVIRPARYGIRDARGYLLYWESESSAYQAVDSWTIYKTVAATDAAARLKQPGIRVEQR